MMAFLASWLNGLPSPVFNRPTPVCLMGPNWRQEQWVHAAADWNTDPTRLPAQRVERRAVR